MTSNEDITPSFVEDNKLSFISSISNKMAAQSQAEAVTSPGRPSTVTPPCGHAGSPRCREKDEAMNKEDCEFDGTIRVQSGSGFRILTPFPWRLHEMLEDMEKTGQQWIVSWLPGGRSFQVHCPTQFVEVVSPKYFRHKRYKSFQRQLYLYGFKSVEDTVSRGK